LRTRTKLSLIGAIKKIFGINSCALLDGILKAEIDIEALHAKRLKLFGVSNKLRTAEQRASAMPDFKKLILPLIDSGKIVPMIYKTLAFEQLLEAKSIMDSNQHLGKIILAGTQEQS
jgi:NADPH:quinone reductase-like Zn-dependent oxidoreductase